MKFCYTPPLLKFLKIELPSVEEETAPFFCWDLHILTVQGRKTALAMNRNSRYSILLYGMKETDWKVLPELIEQEIKAVILREGLSEFEAARYFALGGPLRILLSHGQTSTASLNWAMGALRQRASLLDSRRLSQPRISQVMNDEVYYSAKFSKEGTPREFFLEGFRCL